MTRRRLMYGVAVAATLVSSCAIAAPELTVPSELQPSFAKARFVKPADEKVLTRYRHEQIKFITFHHEGFADGVKSNFDPRRVRRESKNITERVQNIHNDHVTKKLGMIAYNYVVDKSGNIARGRPVSYAPGTFTKDPRTGRIADFTGHLAVMVLGDFDFEPLPPAGRLGLIKVMSEAQRKFKVPTSHIQPHRDHVTHNGQVGTTCPGTQMYSVKDELARMALIYGIQTELSARGCDAGSSDGVLNQRTREAFARLKQTQPEQFKADVISDESLFTLLARPDLSCR